MDERRKYRRSPAKEKAFFKSRENKPHAGLLIDVSSGGMRISSEANIKVGTRLSGQFKIMPDSGNFYVHAEVVWSKPRADQAQTAGYEVGIRFSKVSTIAFPGSEKMEHIFYPQPKCDL